MKYEILTKLCQIMATQTFNTLAEYIEYVLEERNLSQRALADIAGISHKTIGRILAGDPVDPDTIRRLAEILPADPVYLFRLVGYLPKEDDELKNQLVREIEYLMKKLPEESQRRILEIIRVEHRLQAQGDDSGE